MNVFQQPNGRWRAEPSNLLEQPYIVGYGDNEAAAIADAKRQAAPISADLFTLNWGACPSGGWWLYSVPTGRPRSPIGATYGKRSNGDCEGSALSWLDPSVKVTTRSVAATKKRLFDSVASRIAEMSGDELHALCRVGGNP